jgi:tRNA-2-methylthio-N6-dimethylallyladenosine synthase
VIKKYYIETFGCQMNVHDSEKISGILKAEGYSEVSEPQNADILVFNTCSIREKAEQKFFSRLGRLKNIKKSNPGLKIVVAGCIAQQEQEKILKRTPYVDYIVGPQNLHMLRGIYNNRHNIACEENPDIAHTDYLTDRKNGVKAWVTVMYGCDNYCSYCVVPYTRGHEKSRPDRKIIEEVSQLAAEGIREITFLGQNVNSYRSDIDFPMLLKKINDIEGIKRIRFVTSHPKDLSPELARTFRELSKVCEHIHLPLQSGSSRILELMNRRYSYPEYLDRIRTLRELSPDIAITTDIIAGFPGESEADHKATLEALREIQFDGIFAFKYSPRPGTKAVLLEENLDEATKSARLYEIIDTQNSITDRKNKLLKGSQNEILVESVIHDRAGRSFEGRTRSNKIVNFYLDNASGKAVSLGDIVMVEIVRTFRHRLTGTLL